MYELMARWRHYRWYRKAHPGTARRRAWGHTRVGQAPWSTA